MTTENALAGKVGEAVIAEEDVIVTPEVITEETPDQKESREYSEKVQKRINSEVGRRKQAEVNQHKAELEAAEARGKAEALELAQAAPTNTLTPDAPTVPGGRETFETDDDWLSAHKTYDTHQIRESIRKEMQENQEASTKKFEADRKKENEAVTAANAAKTFTESVNEARKKHADYDEVITNPDLYISKDVVDILQESDNGGEVAYYLAKNTAEADRISQLSPIAIAREVGKIESRLAEPPKKKISGAPDPLNPVSSGGSETPTKNPDDMSMDEYEKWRYGSGA